MAASSLLDLLAEIPEEIFWVCPDRRARPHYNRVFAELLRRRQARDDHQEAIPLAALYGAEVPCITYLPGAIDLEAARRRVAGPPRFPSKPGLRQAMNSPPLPPPVVPLPLSTPQDLERVAAEARGYLPRNTADKFLTYLRAAAPSARALRVGIDTYLAQLPEVRANHDTVDYSLAVRLAEVSHALVDATSESPAAERSLAAAGVAYFVDSDDEEHDLLSPIGFYDDAVVLGFVVRTLDLKIPVPVPSRVPGRDT